MNFVAERIVNCANTRSTIYPAKIEHINYAVLTNKLTNKLNQLFKIALLCIYNSTDTDKLIHFWEATSGLIFLHMNKNNDSN